MPPMRAIEEAASAAGEAAEHASRSGILPGKLAAAVDWLGEIAARVKGGTGAEVERATASPGAALAEHAAPIRGADRSTEAFIGSGDLTLTTDGAKAASFQITDGMRGLVPKLSEVAPGYLRSALPSAEGLAMMRDAGLKTVVVLRHSIGDVEAEQRLAQGLGLNFVHIATNGETPLTRGQVGQFRDVIDNAALSPVLWHCVHGKERTGAFTALFRMIREGKSNEAAIQEAVDNGFRAHEPQFQPLLRSLRAFPKFLDEPPPRKLNEFESGLNLPNK